MRTLTERQKAIITSIVTQEDQRLEKIDKRYGRGTNIYRIGLYLEAANNCKTIEDISEYFTEELAAKILKHIEKDTLILGK